MGVYLVIECLACGEKVCIGEDRIDQPEYRCPHCGIQMAKSQWHRAKVDYFVSEELLRQAATLLGDELQAVEIRAFDVACYGPNGLPVTFNTSCNVTVSRKDIEELQDMGFDTQHVEEMMDDRKNDH